MKTVTLQPQHFTVQRLVDLKTEAKVGRDVFFDAMRLELHACILGTGPEVTEFQWPADWVEALKERWLPLWAKKRWPVFYNHIRVSRTGLYPEIPWNGQQLQPIHFMDVQRWTYPDDSEGK